ncbi:MAG TPA: C1 family peptidase [Flavobacteriales bacterium]
MAIRMTPDEGSSEQRRSTPDRRSGGGFSGGGGLGGLLPMLIGLLLKNPKLLLLVAVGFGIFYFIGGSEGCNTGGAGANNVISGLLQTVTGANFDPKLYDRAEVYEPLADNVNAPLPERISLESFAPERLNQGQQGSCVAWASAYAARTIVQAKATGQKADAVAFSPSYLYNQIKIDNSDCQGSYIFRAMDNMLKGGVLPFSKFAYTDQSCAKQPSIEERRTAEQYRIKGFQRLSLNGDDQRTDMVAMKQQLAQGSPVVIGMMVGGSFMQEMEGRELWTPTSSDYQQSGFGGHAMCVIGYDDYFVKGEKEGGAFQIMNSWGKEWGRNGIAWVRYSDFDFFAKEAYAVYPQSEDPNAKPAEFDIRFGLVLVDAKGRPTGEHIGLSRVDGRVFRSDRPIVKGSRFKVEVTNNAECYTYIFGQVPDSTYVLFPYTAKHSPYCGITGTRIFPKDYSLTADDMGQRDVMALLITNQPFDYPKVNEQLKAAPGGTMNAKLEGVLGQELIPADAPVYSQGGTFGAKVPATRNAMAIVLEIDKR